MADGVSVESAQFRRAASRLQAAGPELRRNYAARLREVAKPFANDVLVTGASGLPRRGGLSFRVAQGRPRVVANALRVEVTVGGKYAKGLGGVDEGQIKHPVFNRRNAAGKREVVTQRVTPHLFRRPFEAGAPRIRAALLRAGQETLSRIST
jgi:hypothetical protein